MLVYDIERLAQRGSHLSTTLLRRSHHGTIVARLAVKIGTDCKKGVEFPREASFRDDPLTENSFRTAIRKISLDSFGFG